MSTSASEPLRSLRVPLGQGAGTVVNTYAALRSGRVGGALQLGNVDLAILSIASIAGWARLGSAFSWHVSKPGAGAPRAPITGIDRITASCSSVRWAANLETHLDRGLGRDPTRP